MPICNHSLVFVSDVRWMVLSRPRATARPRWLYLCAIVLSVTTNALLVVFLALDRTPAPLLARSAPPAISLELLDRRTLPTAETADRPIPKTSRSSVSPPREAPRIDPRKDLSPSVPFPRSSPNTAVGISPEWSVETGRDAAWRTQRLADCQRRDPSGSLPPHCPETRGMAARAPAITGSGDRRRDAELEAQATMNERWRRYREEGGPYPGLRTLPSQF